MCNGARSKGLPGKAKAGDCVGLTLDNLAGSHLQDSPQFPLFPPAVWFSLQQPWGIIGVPGHSPSHLLRLQLCWGLHGRCRYELGWGRVVRATGQAQLMSTLSHKHVPGHSTQTNCPGPSFTGRTWTPSPCSPLRLLTWSWACCEYTGTLQGGPGWGTGGCKERSMNEHSLGAPSQGCPHHRPST